MSDTPTSVAKKEQENPLLNIIINVLAPVLILSYLSKEGHKPYHIGPMKAMVVALALPIGYAIWHFIKTRKLNVFSVVGFLSVLLTGVITLYIWSDDSPEHRAKAGFFFGMKEAIQPLILGSLFLITHRSKTPLFNTFIYNDSIFNLKKIEHVVSSQNKHDEYRALLWMSTLLFFGSFLISSGLNFWLANYFMGDLDPHAADWKELYNADVAKITGYGFLVIGAPLLVIGGFIIFKLISGLKSITQLDIEELLHAR